MPTIGRKKRKRISLDTETTGLDHWHGARPYFVTICDDQGEVSYWEWKVDPLTRRIIKKTKEYNLVEDLREIQSEINKAESLVLQNAPFDFNALSVMYADYGLTFSWPWDRLHDTLLSAHLLDSKKPKDLTALSLMYLGIDIQPYDDVLKRACHEARRHARSKYPDWAIAKAGRPDMPSAKSGKSTESRGAESESPWKFDAWLPRAIAEEEGLPTDHPWHTVLRDYANTDSAVTLPIHDRHMALLGERGLEKIYNARRAIPRLVCVMQEKGITVNKTRLEELEKDYTEETRTAANRLRRLSGYGPCKSCKGGSSPPKRSDCKECGGSGEVELLAEMPKGINGYLRYAAFENLNLPEFTGRRKKGKTTVAPTMDASAVEWWLMTLPSGSKQRAFVRNMSNYRKRMTALSYMSSYRRFGLNIGKGWLLIHPGLNSTGTDTLRWSSKNPNEQNISKKEDFNLRYCFGPAPGREWWSMDARNIELRIPAYESGEQEMIDLFERPDEPPYYGSNHLLNFHTVYDDIWEKVLKEVGPEQVGLVCKKRFASTWYQYCKNGGFAVQYGAINRDDGQGTADLAFHRPGSHERLKSRFRKMEEHNQWCIAFAEDNGYIETMPDKTVDPTRGYPLVCTRTENGGILPTVPLNYRTQGTAMWWMMKAMHRCQEFLDQLNREVKGDTKRHKYHMIMQVHDELVFEMPSGGGPEQNLWIAKELARLMALGGEDIGIPTPTSIEYHPVCWSEGSSQS